MGLTSDALKAVDVVLGRAMVLLLALRSARRRGGADTPVRKILVIRPGGIGDAVLLFPMLHGIRECWPTARLDVLVEGRNAGIFAGNGVVNRVLRYDRLRSGVWSAVREGYDLVIDSEQTHYLSAAVARLTGAPRRVGFGSNRRRWMFTHLVRYSREVYEVYSFLDLLKAASGREIPFDRDRPFYPLDDSHRRWADGALEKLSGHSLAIIHPGASTPLRRWDPERYHEIARRLLDRGLSVVLIGGPADRSASARVVQGLPPERVLDLSGRTSLVQAAAVIEKATLYVSADTGPLHLAYGLGVPTVHLFGPGELEKWAPAGTRYRSVRHPVPCSPCTRYGHTPPCCHGVRCMEELSVSQVDQAIDELLAE